MKRTGMTRPLDSLGRIVLPKELRMTMEIDIGDPLEFFIEDQTLMLRKYKSTNCIFAVRLIPTPTLKISLSAMNVQPR